VFGVYIGAWCCMWKCAGVRSVIKFFKLEIFEQGDPCFKGIVGLTVDC